MTDHAWHPFRSHGYKRWIRHANKEEGGNSRNRTRLFMCHRCGSRVWSERVPTMLDTNRAGIFYDCDMSIIHDVTDS